MPEIIILYFVLINFITYYAMKSDKRRARQSIYRFPERSFFIMAIIGGSLGAIIGMWHFRHKTRHFIFVVGMPFILIIQIILSLIIFR